MAKLITLTLPARAEGNELDYQAHYDKIKDLMKTHNPTVTLPDDLVYEDGKIAGNAEAVEPHIQDAIYDVLKRAREVAVGFKRMKMRITDLATMEIDDDIDVQLVFPNKKPKTLEGSVRLKAAGGTNTKNRVKRPVERVVVQYDCDLQRLDPDEQLLNKIVEIAEMGPGRNQGGLETVHGVSVHHHTIPSANMSVFYTWERNTMKVYGIGSHSGKDGDNSQYDVEWFNGDKFTYRR